MLFRCQLCPTAFDRSLQSFKLVDIGTAGAIGIDPTFIVTDLGRGLHVSNVLLEVGFSLLE